MKRNMDDMLRAADGAGPGVNMEIYIRDGEGNVRSLVASGGRSRGSYTFCQDHFIAHGVCVDCSQKMGEPVWAS